MEGLFGGRITGLAKAIEDAPRRRDLFGFVAEKRVLQGDLRVVGLQPHRFLELGARQGVLADL